MTMPSSIDKIIQTSINIIHDRVKIYKKRNFEDWNSFPGVLFTFPQNGITSKIDRIPQFLPIDIPYFTAVIHVTQLMKRSNAPILTIIRNLWNIKQCNQYILQVRCDLNFESFQKELEAFLPGNILTSTYCILSN